MKILPTLKYKYAVVALLLAQTLIASAYADLQLSEATLSAIQKTFSTNKLVVDDKLAIKIKNRTKIEDKRARDNYVEGHVIVAEFGTRPHGVDAMAVYLEGNRRPLAAVIYPGESLFGNTGFIYHFGLRLYADTACYDKYLIVFVVKRNGILYATTRSVRPIIADCDQ